MKLIYPPDLPISSHRQELVEAIRRNDVTIIEGETGSGKSTQIPKMMIEAFDGKAIIACTQPRRIAAVSIATRIAEECEVDLGTAVGYRIRFDDYTYSGTQITICTDGILLQEVKFDRLFSKYDVVFVDEAHERSLRIDFLLGLLKDIQKKRLQENLKPLKIVIASATLDTQKFFNFFNDASTTVQTFSVSGRMFPVDVKYHPLSYDEDLFVTIKNLVKEIHLSKKPGDMLVFLPGEQEIMTAINAIQSLGFRDLACLPLFSRLPMEEQTAIFAPHPGKRHVVVSTNIAETSLTVPGIITVIDSGLARMTDFDVRTGIGSLTVQKISQASAIQRTGRAGRIEPGTCFRLYDEEDFKRREFFTRPEIQRSDLADVVLQMLLMEIPNIHSFQFIDPPSRAAFEQALGTLKILGALDRDEKLTELGYKMAHLPLDPRISRMLISAEEFDCVAEVAVIASFLSLKDPFVRPFGDEDAADRARSRFQKMGMTKSVIHSKPYWSGRKLKFRKRHAPFGKSHNSDLLTYLALWRNFFSFENQSDQEQYCKSHYLDFQTLGKAREIYQQLTETLVQFYGEEFEPHLEKLRAMMNPEELRQEKVLNTIGILRSVASGLVQNLCQRNIYGNYTSAKADRIYIHPSSLFYNRQPQWIIATEIIETTKLFARNITEVDPQWFPHNIVQQKPHHKKNRFKNHRNKRKWRQ